MGTKPDMRYLLLIFLIPLFQQDFKNEVENSKLIADKSQWETEVVMDDGSRCDILTDTHAVEVEWATKWKEAPAQAVLYGIFTGKKPKVILLTKSRTKEKVYILRCKLVCQELGIDMEVVDAQ
jgi:hypothetical protein